MRFLSCVCVSSSDGRTLEFLIGFILFHKIFRSSNLNEYSHNLHLLIAFPGLNKDSSNYVAQCKFNSLFLSSIRQKRNLSSTTMHFFGCFVLLSLFHQPILFFYPKTKQPRPRTKTIIIRCYRFNSPTVLCLHIKFIVIGGLSLLCLNVKKNLNPLSYNYRIIVYFFSTPHPLKSTK